MGFNVLDSLLPWSKIKQNISDEFERDLKNFQCQCYSQIFFKTLDYPQEFDDVEMKLSEPASECFTLSQALFHFRFVLFDILLCLLNNSKLLIQWPRLVSVNCNL